MKNKSIYRAASWLGMLILLAAGVYVLVRWQSLPDQVATHYSAAGQIDGWGKKSTLLTLIVISFVLYGLMSAASVIPISAWNMNTGNTERSRAFLCIFRLVVAAGFAYIIVCSALCVPLGGWFLPVFVLGLMVTFAGALASAHWRPSRPTRRKK